MSGPCRPNLLGARASRLKIAEIDRRFVPGAPSDGVKVTRPPGLSPSPSSSKTVVPDLTPIAHIISPTHRAHGSMATPTSASTRSVPSRPIGRGRSLLVPTVRRAMPTTTGPASKGSFIQMHLSMLHQMIEVNGKTKARASRFGLSASTDTWGNTPTPRAGAWHPNAPKTER